MSTNVSTIEPTLGGLKGYDLLAKIQQYYKPSSDDDLIYLINQFMNIKLLADLTNNVDFYTEQCSIAKQMLDELLPMKEAFEELKDVDDNYNNLNVEMLKYIIDDLVITCKTAIDPAWISKNVYMIDNATKNFYDACFRCDYLRENGKWDLDYIRTNFNKL
jgi:galactose-1-phosphate uridylyltransferase